MRILVANDDGVYSPGICALAQVAQNFGEVRVVAPDVEMSSASLEVTGIGTPDTPTVTPGSGLYVNLSSGTIDGPKRAALRRFDAYIGNTATLPPACVEIQLLGKTLSGRVWSWSSKTCTSVSAAWRF